MRSFSSIRFARSLTVAAVLLAPSMAHAQMQWSATVGAQSEDKGRQVLAFLPTDIWIHAGDSVTWRSDVDEIHTVTFLRAGQVRLPFPVGCPGFTASPAVFNGSTCISTPPIVKGQTFTVEFPTAGNFKLVCLVHPDMTAAVHVLAPQVPLPHTQEYYDDQADQQRREMLADHSQSGNHPDHTSSNTVVAGLGEVSANAGGTSTLSVVRFVHESMVIHAGETVEWNVEDPATPHTVTFGAEPANVLAPSGNVTQDADGALHAVINSPSDAVNSGLIALAPQDRIGLPQAPLGTTRFRITFTHAGVYPYICALHDDLGMKGTIKVLP